jgi:hypothetical protein
MELLYGAGVARMMVYANKCHWCGTRAACVYTYTALPVDSTVSLIRKLSVAPLFHVPYPYLSNHHCPFLPTPASLTREPIVCIDSSSRAFSSGLRSQSEVLLHVQPQPYSQDGRASLAR